MAIDYDIYAEGEALLGWLNATLQLEAPAGFDSGAVLRDIARDIRDALGEAQIAHLKMTLSPEGGLGDIAVVNLVRNDFVPELSLTLEQPVIRGQLILNLRAEADPETLHRAVTGAVAVLAQKPGAPAAVLEHMEHFRPGKPQPTHRDLGPVPA
jgi:hypothetical protein